MKNIVDLKPALDQSWLKQQRARLDPLALFTLDYADISRHSGTAANGDATDPMTYGPTARAQLQRLCDAFGFERLPATWAEFKGMTGYCHMLHGMLLGPRGGPLADEVRASGLNVVKQYFPKDYAAAEAFFDDNVERMRAIHQADDTLTRLGKEHREFTADE